MAIFIKHSLGTTHKGFRLMLSDSDDKPVQSPVTEVAGNQLDSVGLSFKSEKKLRPLTLSQAASGFGEHGEESITSQFQRRFPHPSLNDTVARNGKYRYGGKLNNFADEEITKEHKLTQKERLGHNSWIYLSENSKHVIQQQALRGCTAACSQMLACDHGKSPDHMTLLMRNLGNTEHMVRDLNNHGLKANVTMVTSLNELKLAIETHGSAIVHTTSPSVGGHVVVVDAVDDESVRLRDPYHGWEISVKRDAFEKQFDSRNDIIQVVGSLS